MSQHLIRMLRWIRRGILAIIALLLLLIGAGFTYETIMEIGDAERYPYFGQLVEVDGYTMHIHCKGIGSPTVILESGAGGFSISNQPMQQWLREETRVCVYDRAGMGWSDPRPKPRTAWQIAHELHALLQAANVESPYVLVGPSNGGLYVRAFAVEYADETAGLALLDPTFENTLAETKGLPNSVYLFMARIGVFRLTANSEELAVMAAHRAKSINWETYAAEWETLQSAEQIELMKRRVGKAGTLGNIPLGVISANQLGIPVQDMPPQARAAFEEEENAMRSLSTNVRYLTVISDHGLSNQQVLVQQMLRDVINAARTGTRLD